MTHRFQGLACGDSQPEDPTHLGKRCRPHCPSPKSAQGVVFELDFANTLLTEQPRTKQNNSNKVLVTVRFLVVRNYRRSCPMLTANPKSSPVTFSGPHDCKDNRRGGKGAADCTCS